MKRTAIYLVLSLAVPALAVAQGDGPHNLPLIPKDTNIFVVLPLGLSGNFNPQQTTLVPGAEIDVFAVPLTYIRTFSLAGRFGRVLLTAPLATLDASGIIADPRTGEDFTVSRGRSGWMDPIVTLHLGLVGAPALAPAEFVQRPKSFQMFGIVGAAISIGTYDASRVINLGTNRWAFRVGVGTVTPLSKSVSWESANTAMLFTDNNDVFGPAETRSQDPLFVSENHFIYQFDPKWWSSFDLRWQYGGETQTDGAPDDNLTNVLGAGLTLGHQFTQRVGAYVSYGRVVIQEGDAQSWMIRGQITYSF